MSTARRRDGRMIIFFSAPPTSDGDRRRRGPYSAGQQKRHENSVYRVVRSEYYVGAPHELRFLGQIVRADIVCSRRDCHAAA